MPPFEHMDFHNRAILWNILRHDKHGMPVISSPISICCRWEEGQTEMVNSEGQNLIVDVVMATNHNILSESLLWEGTVTQLNALNGFPQDNIYEIMLRRRADSLNGRIRRYEYGLKRFKDTLPKVV